MADYVYYDRVRESTSTTGTGTLTLAGPITGFQSFACVGNGNKTFYCIEAVDSSGIPTTGWEVGKGTYTSSGTTLSRDTVLFSSNSGSKINLVTSAHVFIPYPATVCNSFGAAGSTHYAGSVPDPGSTVHTPPYVLGDAAAWVSLATALPRIADGRLTTESGIPVSSGDRNVQGAIYYTPAIGNRISLYDGSNWILFAFSEISLTLTATSGKNYDVFVYNNSGTLTMELSSAWTDNTTRADALTTQDGVYVKSGSTTKRWVGTIRANGSNVTEDSSSNRFVYNAANRVPRQVKAIASASSWTYSSVTFRSSNADSTLRVSIVNGQSFDTIDLTVYGLASGAAYVPGIAEDATNTNSANATALLSPGSGAAYPAFASLIKQPGIGYHFYQWTESASDAVSVTVYGTNLPYRATGINGTWAC